MLLAVAISCVYMEKVSKYCPFETVQKSSLQQQLKGFVSLNYVSTVLHIYIFVYVFLRKRECVYEIN